MVLDAIGQAGKDGVVRSLNAAALDEPKKPELVFRRIKSEALNVAGKGGDRHVPGFDVSLSFSPSDRAFAVDVSNVAAAAHAERKAEGRNHVFGVELGPSLFEAIAYRVPPAHVDVFVFVASSDAIHAGLENVFRHVRKKDLGALEGRREPPSPRVMPQEERHVRIDR